MFKRIGLMVYMLFFATYHLARFVVTGRKAWEDIDGQ
jgi:hypothetical protein